MKEETRKLIADIQSGDYVPDSKEIAEAIEDLASERDAISRKMHDLEVEIRVLRSVIPTFPYWYYPYAPFPDALPSPWASSPPVYPGPDDSTAGGVR